METNTIYCGDNLEQLSKLPEKSVDLIYADPPFFSNKHYEVIWNDGAEIRAFEDRWQGGISHYIGWMEPRLRECHRVLKDTGSMYLHCDWHANAHLRILMDEIFGENNFRNEIIWHYNSGARGKWDFGRRHDTLLRYSKTKQYLLNLDAVREPYSPDINIPKSKEHYYNPLGKVIDDVWCIPIISQNDKTERLGYPTQKPESLLRRIIEASSNKGDIVLDPFCGCGTTIAVAQQLSRQWVGIDVSPTACRMMKERLTKIGAKVNLIGMPTTIAELKKLEPFAFQEWVVNRIGGTHQNKKVNDKGIDGWTFMKHKPVQVKQSENIGRNVIDNFQPAMERVNATEGFVYAFSFTRGAFEEVARVSSKKGTVINLITIEELLKKEATYANS